MYPHERSLVKRLEGKPFVIVGVNSDSDREKIKQRIKDEHITWRSWWDQPDARTDGRVLGETIAQQWHIKQWPSIFVIDANGVIRFRDVRGQKLDSAIDGLLKDMGVTVQPHPPPPE